MTTMMTDFEMAQAYRMARNPREQLRILSELNQISVDEVKTRIISSNILNGFDQRPMPEGKGIHAKYDHCAILKWHSEGLTLDEIHNKCGIDKHYLRNWLYSEGLLPNPPREK